MAPDVASDNEWQNKESGKASFQRDLYSNANQLTPGAGEIPLTSVSLSR